LEASDNYGGRVSPESYRRLELVIGG